MKHLIRKILKEEIIKNGELTTQTLYHGTKYIFDKFDLNFFNSGSGDGAYVVETRTLNLFIFNPNRMKIIDKDCSLNELKIRNFIRKELRKVLLKENELITEKAFNISQLSQGTGLFIDENNSGASITLYNPKSNEVYATITFISHISEGPFHWVSGVAAKKGYGPLIYELAFMFVHDNNSRLMPSRDGNVRGEAFNVWKKMYNRDDVDKLGFNVTDNNFKFDILTGVDDGNISKEDKIEWFNNSSNEEKLVLKVFNTAFSKQPNSDYRRLISIANNYSEKIQDKAHEAGDLLWQSSYD